MAKSPRQPSAIKVNDRVVFKGLPCVVNRVNPDGTLHLLDEDGDDYEDVPADGIVMQPTGANQDGRRGPGNAFPNWNKARRIPAEVLDLPEIKALTGFQQRFVTEMAADPGSHTAAWLRAGGQAKDIGMARQAAHYLSKRPAVAAALQVLKQLHWEMAQYDAQQLMIDLQHQYEIASAVLPVLDSDGNPTGVYKINNAAAIKCLEIRARLLGLLKDKVELTGKDGGPLQVQHQVGVSVLGAEGFARLTKEERADLLRLWRKAKGEEEAPALADNKPVVIVSPARELNHADAAEGTA